MAAKFDKVGQRTLGVLTKPDLVDKGAENRVVDLVEGKSSAADLCKKFAHGTDFQ